MPVCRTKARLHSCLQPRREPGRALGSPFGTLTLQNFCAAPGVPSTAPGDCPHCFPKTAPQKLGCRLWGRAVLEFRVRFALLGHTGMGAGMSCQQDRRSCRADRLLCSQAHPWRGMRRGISAPGCYTAGNA